MPVAIKKEVLSEEDNEVKKALRERQKSNFRKNRQNCRYLTERTLGHSILIGVRHYEVNGSWQSCIYNTYYFQKINLPKQDFRP